jgi:four helix bundle protein
MIYKVTKTFPKEECYGLVSQLRRAAVSVSSNIAEGFRRKSATEKVHFYTMALSSLTEIQSQSLVARDIAHLTIEVFQPLAEQSNRVGKLINGLAKSAPERPY